jgi:hypothetical protein
MANQYRDTEKVLEMVDGWRMEMTDIQEMILPSQKLSKSR